MTAYDVAIRLAKSFNNAEMDEVSLPCADSFTLDVEKPGQKCPSTTQTQAGQENYSTRLHLGDSTAWDLILLDVDPESKLDQNLELRARIESTDIESRICLGIPVHWQR